MSLMLENKQGLIAGDGTLPVKMAQYAKENGFEVICISLSNDNLAQLKKYCAKVYSCHPGEVNRIAGRISERKEELDSATEKANSSLNQNAIKAKARHENTLTLEELLKMVTYLLKNNASFYMVHRTERLIEIIETLKKYKLTPKCLQFIYPYEGKESKLFMIKATKNGREGIKVLDAMYIHNEDLTYQDKIKEIFK